MTFDRFVGEVQHRARLASLGDAVGSIRCTLGVLGQRLAGGEAKDLASQLPREIAFYLEQPGAGQGLQMGVGEFLDQVSHCQGVDKAQAVHHVRSVFEVLREAVTAGQIRHLLNQLPQEFAPLFEAGSRGKMRLRKRSRLRTSGSRSSGRRGRSTLDQIGQGNPMAEQEKPRSARIGQRARGAWHLGR